MALDTLPPLYYINLDHRSEKRDYMERLLHAHGVVGTRIAATNGLDDIRSLLYHGVVPKGLKSTQLACTISHLRAIRHWLTTSDTDTALICEDDVSFDTVANWPFTWATVMSQLPYYWDMFQCCITYHPMHPATISLHPHQTTDFSCVAYVIRRRYAEKLMDLYWRDGTWTLDYPSIYTLTAEEVLYKPGVCISLPMFTYTNEFESSIQTKEHMNQYHTPSREFVLDVWKQVRVSRMPMRTLLQLDSPVTMAPMQSVKMK